MGWCHEFGLTVRADCGHPMQAGQSACHCAVCGVVCEGQFAGCATVWANGPRTLDLVRPVEQGERLGLAGRRPAVTGVAAARGDEAGGASPLVHGGTALYEEEEPEAPVAEMAPTKPEAESPEAKTPPEAGPLAVLAEEQAHVFEWQASFHGQGAQLRVLSDAVDRQQAMAAFTGSGAAADRLAQLANALPGRIGEAVREAMVTGRGAASIGPGNGQAPLLSMPDVEGPAPQPEPPAPLTAPSTAGAASEGRRQDPRGVRTQLTTMASSIQSRIHRSGRQDKARALRSARDSPGQG